MAATSYRPSLRVDLSPSTHWYFEVYTSSEVIQPGDLVQLNMTTQKVQLLAAATVTEGHKYVGISNSYWSSSMNDALLRNRIEVLNQCVVEVPVIEGSYTIGEFLEFSTSDDNGTLRSWQSGNQKVGRVFEVAVGTVTSLKMIFNIFDEAYGLMEASS